MKKFFYRVKKGETIMVIGAKFNVCIFKLIEDNGLIKEVECGDLLYIECDAQSLYLVKPRDTLLSLSKKFNTSQDLILKENNIPYIFCGLKIKI